MLSFITQKSPSHIRHIEQWREHTPKHQHCSHPLRSHDILLFQVEAIELSIEISNQIWQSARTVGAVSFTSLFPRWDHQRAARQGVLGDGEMSRIDLRPGDLHNPKDVAVRGIFQPARAIRIIERARVPYSNILVALQNFRNGTDRLEDR